MRGAPIVLLALLLSACGAGRTIVLDPAERSEIETYVAASVVHGEDTIEVPEKVTAAFGKELDRAFFGDKGAFEKGDDGLKVTYRFLQFDPGNRFSRWFFGGIGNAGEATMLAEIRFDRPDGVEMARIQVEGKIGSGFFGGATDSALEKAAKEAADYARAHFAIADRMK
ncbi:MAG: hypothetical protein D6807_05670 [Alphaproteobacteria bacterium]|nr:MAG: hypothetical protein D6807_05670 [Alphaproteobacteria bacterium]